MTLPSASPITLATHRRWRFTTLCALYFAQGIPYGFVTIALVAFLSKAGASPAQTGGIVALSLLPWTFKIVWGPIIDSYRVPSLGQRRPWIVLAQFMMATTLLVGVSTADLTSESTLALLGVIVFIHNCFNSLQDVATDALAIDLLDDQERGRVNAFMWASKLLGVTAGGAGIGTIIARTNVQTGMRMQALILLLIMLLPILLRERPGDKMLPWSRTEHGHRRPAHIRTGPLRVMRQLIRAFSLWPTALGVVLAFFVFIGEGLSIPVNGDVFTTRLGWSAEHYAHMQGVFGTIGKLVGAIGGGMLCDRFGPRRMVALGASVTASTFLLLAILSTQWVRLGDSIGIYFLTLEAGLAMTSVSLFSLFMRMSWTTAAATQFTLYMTVLNLGNAFGATLTHLSLDHVGSYVLCAAVSCIPALIVTLIDASVVERLKRSDQASKPLVEITHEDQPTAVVVD